MSQLPQPQVADEFTRLLEGELNQQNQRNTDILTSANPFAKVLLDPNLKPTFDPQEVGFGSAVGARITQGAAELSNIQFGEALMSVPEMIAAGQIGDGAEVPGPYLDNNKNMLIKGLIVSSDKVRVEDFWEDIPAPQKAILNQAGIDLEFLNKQQYVTGADFAKFYPRFLESARASQTIESYREQHSLMSKAAGVTAFASNFVDPVIIATGVLSLGTATPEALASKVAAKQAGRVGLRATASKFVRGPTDAVLRRVAQTGERRGIAHLLSVGGGGIIGAQYGLTGDQAQQINALELGLMSPEDYRIHYSSAGIGLALGSVLGEFAYRGLSKGKIPNSRTIHLRNEVGADTLGHMKAVADSRVPVDIDFRYEDMPPNMFDIGDSDAVEDILQSLYNPIAVRDVARYLSDPDTMANTNMSELYEFLEKLPTVLELEDALSSPNGFVGLDTTFSSLSDNINTLIKQRDELLSVTGNEKKAKRVQTKINTLSVERDALISENFTLDPIGLADVVSSKFADIPIETLRTSAERVTALAGGLEDVIANNFKDYRSRNVASNIHSISSITGSNFLMPRQAIKADGASLDPVVSFIGRIGTVINSRGADGAEAITDRFGKQVISAESESHFIKNTLVNNVDSAYSRLVKKGRDPQADGLNLYRHRILGEPLDPELAELNKAFIDDYLEVMGTRALKAGTIENKLENFINFAFNRVFDASKAKPAVKNAFTKVYGKIFDPDDLNAPVSYKALQKSGFLDRVDGKFTIKDNPSTGLPYFDELPKAVKDLDPDVLALYRERLSESLDSDGLEFYSNRQGRANEESLDKTGLEGFTLRNSSINSKKSRVAEQEIYLDDEVVASGLIDFDVSHAAHSYLSTAGYNLFRDEATSSVFGQKVLYRDLEAALSQLSSGDQKRTAALKRLQGLDTRQSNRFTVNKGGAVFASVANNLSSILVSGRVFMNVISTEGSFTVLRSIMPKSDLISQVKIIADGMGRIKDKEQLAQIGLGSVNGTRSTRFVANLNEHLPDEASENIAVLGSKFAANAARTLFLEKHATSMLKSVNHSVTFAKLFNHRKKIDRMIDELPLIFPEGKELRALARRMNMDVDELSMLKRFGVLQPEALREAKLAMEVDPNILLTHKNFLNYLNSDDFKGNAKDADNLFASLSRMAFEDAQTFIATPSASDIELSQSPLMNLMFSLASFNASFYNNTMTRLGQSPYWKQAGAWSILLGSEISLSITRDLLYGGESIDTIKQKWEDEPEKNLAMAIARLPVQGPFSLVPSGIYGLATGSPLKAVEDLTGSAALSMLSRSGNAIYQAGGAIIEGEELTDREKREMNKYLPGTNAWIFRLLDEASTGFEEDGDK